MSGKTTTDAALLRPKKSVEQVKNPLIEISQHEVLEAKCSSSIESFGKFYERRQYSLDSLEYPRDGDDPGLVLIFNQQDFDNNYESREGSSKDVKALITSLGRLGFNIKKENIFKNLSKEDLFREVDEVLKSDLSQINSLLVFIMSHGENCNQLLSRTSVFQFEDLLMKFENCAALKGKPKMFVVQACKGRDKTQLSDEKKDILLVPATTFGKIYEDMVILYSTMEGRNSFRHTNYGSWLIQEICRNFTAYGRRDDVATILTRVIKCTCTNYFHYSDSELEAQKQIPVVVSSLSRKFYLNKNKDRHFAIKSSQMQSEILNALKNISDEIEKK